jgi:CRISPR-associated protein Csm1
MKQERQKIYLAALLHDIGKFYQRADNKKENGNFELLDNSYWESQGTYCPKYKGKYSHKHVLWTAKFIQNHSGIFNQLGINAKDGENSLTLLAATHHNPGSNVLAKIIQLADHYSSAVDRDNEEYSLQDGIADNDWTAFKKRRMVSVFEGLKRPSYKDKKADEYAYFFPVKSLNLDKSFFPKKSDSYTKVPDYSELWKQFEKDFEKIPTTSFDVFAETLLSLLHKYTVTVPSSTMHLPDVSLFDHAKTTAAFAVAIYDFYEENNRLPGENDKPLQLIGADISGIQKFIYDIISKNAAKNLKGRSFYLQLMIESILRYTLNKMDLYSASIVYSSGGGFYLLAPNTKDFSEKLKEIESEVSRQLFKAHKTTLFVAMSSVAVAHESLLPKKYPGKDVKEIGKVWGDLMQKLNIKKRQRYADRLVDEYEKFFSPIEQGGESKENRDSITGEEFEEGEKKHKLNDGSIVKKNTKEQVELGKHLKNAKYWIIASVEEHAPENVFSIEPLELGFISYFLKELPKSIPDKSVVLTMNETDFTSMHPNAKYATGFSFYGGNTYPVYENDEADKDGTKHYKGEPQSFDKLVGDDDTGFKRLGILRMDVDNLGQIFINGLSERKRTFSRYSTLSRNLDYYFTGYLNTIQQQKKYKDLTYILYSGGDDLFILGKWNLLIDMAKEIQNDFAQWTCHNENISLSGGVSLVTPKFPILKAATEAEGEEKNAKNYKNGELEKNAFSLWENALSWKTGYEFDVVSDLKNRILELLDKKDGLPKSFIGNISAFYEKRNMALRRKKEIEQGSKKRNINESWQWQMAYQLARFEKEKKNPDVKQLIDEIKINVFINKPNGSDKHLNYEYIELLNIAARWAELEWRTNKKELNA